MREEMAMLCVMLGVAVTTAFVLWAVRCYRRGKLPAAAASGSVFVYTLIWAAIIFWQLPIANGHGVREADLQEMSGRILAAQQYAMEQILKDCKIEPEDIRMCSSSSFEDDPDYHVVWITYEGVDEKNSYGYRLQVDQKGRCSILEQGKEIGLK